MRACYTQITPAQAKAVVPIEKWEDFNRWAKRNGYYEPKPPYRGLLENNGAEWSGFYVIGDECAEVLTVGGQMCFKTRDGKVHTCRVVL